MSLNVFTLAIPMVFSILLASCNSAEPREIEAVMKDIYVDTLAYQDNPKDFNQEILQNQPDSDALEFWEIYTIYVKLVGDEKSLSFIDQLIRYHGLTTIITSPWGTPFLDDEIIRNYLNEPAVRTSELFRLNFGVSNNESRILKGRKLNYSGIWPRRETNDFTSYRAQQLLRSKSQ